MKFSPRSCRAIFDFEAHTNPKCSFGLYIKLHFFEIFCYCIYDLSHCNRAGILKQFLCIEFMIFTNMATIWTVTASDFL